MTNLFSIPIFRAVPLVLAFVIAGGTESKAAGIGGLSIKTSSPGMRCQFSHFPVYLANEPRLAQCGYVRHVWITELTTRSRAGELVCGDQRSEFQTNPGFRSELLVRMSREDAQGGRVPRCFLHIGGGTIAID